jgi:hypothetical protein
MTSELVITGVEGVVLRRGVVIVRNNRALT